MSHNSNGGASTAAPTNNGPQLPFPKPSAADLELVNVHPACLVSPLQDVRDRTTAAYKEWFDRLVADVKANNIRQPILAWKEAGKYPVIDGETRRLAALHAGLTSVPVLVCRERPEGAALKVAMLQANAMRCDMSEMDYAKVYLELLRENPEWTQARLAKELNHPAAVISKRMKVIQHLPADLIARIGEAEGQIPFSTSYVLARAFEKLGDAPSEGGKETPRTLAEKVARGMARDDAERKVDELLGKPKGKGSKEAKPLNLSVAGAKVTLKDGTLESFKALASKLTEAVKAFEKGGYDKDVFRAVVPSLLKGA